jgi:hypothetical protein
MFRIILIGEHPGLTEVVRKFSQMGELEVIGNFPGRGEGMVSKEWEKRIHSEEVQGIVVTPLLAERHFWCEKALEAGKKVLCLIPPARRLDRGNSAFSIPGGGPSLFWANPSLYTSPGEEILFPDGEIGNLLFFDLKISVSRERFGVEKEGMLLWTGLEFLSLIEENWGAVDSIWARARSLVRNRIGEDMVVAHLQFRDGKEGVLQFNGLGDKGEVDLKLFGRRGVKEVSCVHWEADVGVWEKVFRSFIDFATGVGGQRREGKSNVAKGFQLMNWIVQAARFQREIYLNEVIHDG